MTRLRTKAAVHEALASVAAQVGIGSVARLVMFVRFQDGEQRHFEYEPRKRTAAVKVGVKRG